MKQETLFAIFEIIAMIAAVVLFFIGISCAVKTLKADGESGHDNTPAAKKLYKNSFIYIGCAIAAYICVRFFANYGEMTAQGADTLSVFLQALWEGVRNTGFLLLLPFAIRMGRARTVQH